MIRVFSIVTFVTYTTELKGVSMQLMQLPYVGEWDFTYGCFDDEVFSLSNQGKQRLARISARKNWRKYTSVADFLFSELGGKKWAKTSVEFYRGHKDMLIMLISMDELKAWQKTMLVACFVLNSTLEFKTFSAFRRTVLLKAAKEGVK